MKIWRVEFCQVTSNSQPTLVDPGASFDTPGTPGGVSIVEISAF